MKNRVLLLIVFLLLNLSAVIAEQTAVQNQQVLSITQPQNIKHEDCTKMFPVNKEKLFYLTLGAITANKFAIDEIQSNNGYIIFSAANNKYLATVASIDANNSILKITPCNNTYVFPPGVILGMFKYVGMNINIEINK